MHSCDMVRHVSLLLWFTTIGLLKGPLGPKPFRGRAEQAGHILQVTGTPVPRITVFHVWQAICVSD